MNDIQKTERLAKFLCEDLALEPFDHLSRDKYFKDAAAIIAYLGAPAATPCTHPDYSDWDGGSPEPRPAAGLPTGAELQSGMDRQKWAENLILQLPAGHNGRNSWLLNYGRGEVALALRKERELSFNEESLAVNPPAPSFDSTTSDELTKIAAECHRAKWQFETNPEIKIGIGMARNLLAKAFDELHRIGDLALKARDTSPLSRPNHRPQEIIDGQ